MSAAPSTGTAPPPPGRRPFRPWLAALVLLAALFPALAAAPTKVTLQLKWAHQFQFAGYYAAQAKGFYRAAGLDVTLREAGPLELPLPMVEAGAADFGVDDMEVFQAYLEGRPLVALGVVFQHSPTVILSLRRSGIHRPADLAGRTVMFSGGQGLTEARAMLESEGVDLDRLKPVPHSRNLEDLLEGRVDAMSAYATNEPYLLRLRGAQLNVMRPAAFGVDFYGDLLFTTQAFAASHPATTEAFRRASFQGWEYAMGHSDEMISYILALPGVAARGVTRAHLQFEAAQMWDLVLPGLVDIGHMNPGRFRRIAQQIVAPGQMNAVRPPEGFIYVPPAPAGKSWRRALSLAVLAALGAGLLAVLWISQLRRTVNARTRELREEVRQRRQAEEAFLTANQQLFLHAQQTPLGMVEWDTELRVTGWNPAAERIFGYTSREAIGRHVTFIVPKDARPALLPMLFRLVEGQTHDHHADENLRKDGEVILCEWHNTPLRDGTGRVVGVTSLAEDITERRRLEQERQQLQAQLQQAQKLESLGSLAGGVAHDMNNVLGAILAMASLHAEQAAPGSALRRGMETITKAAERGGKMVKSLLSMARQSPAEERELDLNAILREEVRLLERTTLARIRLVLELTPDLRPVLGDASALTHAFINLCVNAVDAMPETGTLTLRTRNLDPAWVEVEVQDTGCGMSGEVLDKAMDPFFTTKEVGQGTGLGLTLVYGTVKAHHGQLQLQSAPGAGTLVRLRFPAWDGVRAAEPAGLPAEPSGASLAVLVVDDDELVQHSMEAILEALGHTTLTVASGEAALQALAGFQPDVVILDLNMPGLGGSGTLPRLRALRPALPVVLATGRPDQSAVDLVAAYPGVTLLAKPFTMRELQRHLEPIGRGEDRAGIH